MPQGTEQGLFKARDGTSLFYELSGNPHGRPLIFCYGLLCRREHWRHQIAHFASQYRIITFDYRGHQRSGTPVNDRNLTLDWSASDIQDLIRHLGLKETVCLGHSMGVPTCVLASLLAPEVKGLVLVCGTLNNPFQRMFYSNRMDLVYRGLSGAFDLAPGVVTTLWKQFTRRSGIGFFITSRLGFNPTLAQEQDVMMYMEGVNQTPLSTFFSFLKDYTSRDRLELLKQVKCPVLIVAGEDDCITPMEHQEDMASLLLDVELYKVKQGSHNAHMDLPLPVNARIDGFLERIGYLP